MPYSLFQKSYITVLFGVIFLVLSLLPLYAFLPSCLYWESRPYLANGQGMNQALGFFVSGTYVKLDIEVSGGDGRVSAQVLNVGLGNITQQASVDTNGFLAFESPKNDYYSLYLQNSYGFFSFGQENDKAVLVKVYYYFYNYIFLALGIAVLGLGVALIINNELKRRARNRLAPPPR